MVLYRLEDGTPAALYDRCPHRWAPLSKAMWTGDKIVCPYHGMEFNTAGLCTKAPTQHMKPKTAKIPSFVGARGRGLHLDLDGRRKTPSTASRRMSAIRPIPAGPSSTAITRSAANWVLIRENVLDLTHIAFLHKNTFKQNDWITAPDTYMEGETSSATSRNSIWRRSRRCSAPGWACPRTSRSSGCRRGGCRRWRSRSRTGTCTTRRRRSAAGRTSSCAAAIS